MRSFLMNLVSYVSLYFLLKFCFVLGNWEGTFWIGEQLSTIHCECVEELNVFKYGTEGQCDAIERPDGDKLVKQALKNTFDSIP